MTTIVFAGCTPRGSYPERWEIVAYDSAARVIEDHFGAGSADAFFAEIALRLDLLFADVPVTFSVASSALPPPGVGHLFFSEPVDRRSTGLGWEGQGRAEVYGLASLLHNLTRDDLQRPAPPLATQWRRMVEVKALIAAHEVGHALGLKHDEDSQIMSGILDARDGWAERWRFTEGEIRQMRCMVYPGCRSPDQRGPAEVPIESGAPYRADLDDARVQIELDHREG